jgi:hypothetical protein
VGEARSGKSFLASRLVGTSAGFPLGHLDASETRGVWLWSQLLPDGAGGSWALLDTEGLDALGT